VDGAAASARHFGMPARLVGMVVVGFGTSAPEMTVSALAAYQGSSGIALGNAYGSNIANIALILGITALISPIVVNSQVLRKELPILAAVTALAAWQVWSGEITRADAWTLLAVFAGVMGWMIWEGLSKTADTLDREVDEQLSAVAMTTPPGPVLDLRRSGAADPEFPTPGLGARSRSRKAWGLVISSLA
jgi:cation:H+ antiporter